METIWPRSIYTFLNEDNLAKVNEYIFNKDNSAKENEYIFNKNNSAKVNGYIFKGGNWALSIKTTRLR